MEMEEIYYRDIVKFKVLSAEQIKKISRDDEEDFKKQLVLRNLRLVVLIAREFRHWCKSCGISFFDLVQEGNIGLIMAARSYKPEKRSKFSVHAGRRIRVFMIREVQKNRGAIFFPYNLQDNVRRMNKVQLDFFKKGKDLSETELADRTYFSEEKIADFLDISQRIVGAVSLDARVDVGGGSKLIKDTIEDAKIASLHGEVEKKELVKAIESLLGTLSRREEKIMRMVFGIGYYTDFNMQEIGDELGISRERVRQIRKRCMSLLRKRAKKLKLTEFL